MAFILNSFFQESDISLREQADDQMQEMTTGDINHMVKVLETLSSDHSLDALKHLNLLNGYDILDDYEYDKNVPQKGLKVIRRKMHALFRKRFKEIMKLRREVKVREPCGHYVTRARQQVLNSYFLPESILPVVKRLAFLSVIEVVMMSIATIFTPLAAMNTVMNTFSSHTSGLWLTYWLPTIAYLITVPLVF